MSNAICKCGEDILPCYNVCEKCRRRAKICAITNCILPSNSASFCKHHYQKYMNPEVHSGVDRFVEKILG